MFGNFKFLEFLMTMSSYSFVEEAVTSDMLTIGSMTTLGINTGGLVGKKAGELRADLKTANLSSSQISWDDPLFISVVKKSVNDAKEAVTLADEWYNSCSIRDKAHAKQEYDDALKKYRTIQRDISYRKADRWLPAYKEALKKHYAAKYQKNGNIIGGGVGFGTGSSAVAIKSILNKMAKYVK